MAGARVFGTRHARHLLKFIPDNGRTMNAERFPVLNREAARVFLDAAHLLGSSLEPEVSISGILRLLDERLSLGKGRVVLPDPESGLLRIRYAIDIADEDRMRVSYALGEGITGRVMKSGETAVIPDVAKEPHYLARVTDVARFTQGPIAFIAVPIRQDSVPIGVLGVHPLPKPRREFEADLLVLQVLAAMIGQVLRIGDLVADHTRALVQENKTLKTVRSDAFIHGIVGESPALRDAINKAHRAAASDTTVMLTGESGSGKERFARMIHLAGTRRDQPFVCVNCAAIPEHLLESELFGHEKGSFTGATSGHIGKFELASKGTLFLDEIGDMRLDLQAKVLRALQERTVQRVGGSIEIPVDARIITATHRNLHEAVAAGEFRQDLYYRLNVIRISLPSLRERDGDIRLLAMHLLNKANQRHGRNIVLSADALRQLESYAWPGNIRQLENIIERLIVMAEVNVVTGNEIGEILQEEQGAEEMPFKQLGSESHLDKITPADARPYVRVRSEDGRTILNAIAAAQGNKTLAARRLGLSPRQLHYRLAKLGTDPDGSTASGNVGASAEPITGQ